MYEELSMVSFIVDLLQSLCRQRLPEGCVTFNRDSGTSEVASDQQRQAEVQPLEKETDPGPQYF